MRVLVCGGRTFSDATSLERVLDRIHAKRPIARIIQGGARGADSLASAWARKRGVSVSTYHADWDLYKASAGRRRNHQMLREGRPDLVVAFPGGRGTMHMVEIAGAAGVPVLRAWKHKDALTMDASLA